MIEVERSSKWGKIDGRKVCAGILYRHTHTYIYIKRLKIWLSGKKEM